MNQIYPKIFTIYLPYLKVAKMADTRTGPPSVHPIKEKQWQFQKRMEDHYYKRGSRYLPFSIEPMPNERQRLIKPMTAEERALRKQWVQDQVLSPNEPRNVEFRPMNGFRKFYRKPWDKFFQIMKPIIVSLMWGTDKTQLGQNPARNRTKPQWTKPHWTKRIHHWRSVGTGKSQPEGPPFQWERRLRRVSHWDSLVSHWNSGPEGWDFPVSLYTNDRFYFSHI